MKCKNCGAQYRFIQMVCPNCNAENRLGRIWMVQRSQAELEYQKKLNKATMQVNPFVINRVLNRILLVTVVLSLVVAFISAGSYFWRSRENMAPGILEDEQAYMEKLYDRRDFRKLEDYMTEHNLIGTQNYKYSQAIVMSYSYQDYIQDKLCFLEMSEEQKQQDSFYLRYAISNSYQVYRCDTGIYEELDPENELLYKEYYDEVQAFWKGILGLEQSEINAYILYQVEDEFISVTNINVVESIAKARRAWRDE